ncbi:hypothetical protein [Bradyrhizobium sp.]|uniref:hypothetical protein n=1 Tax=Bradyrhizobium sp. TaxID=376 RepID=UPI0039E36883
MPQTETVRCFWHGSPLGPYQLAGMRSFVDQGHRVELFTYDPAIAVPDWIVRRDANEIWPTDRVLAYQKDIGRGSFALHSNLFRYAMLHQLGGWWIDHDVILLRPELPADPFFFSIETVDPTRVTFSVVKFPAGHPALQECLERCVALGESPLYGETGADLFTEIVVKHGLAKHGQAMDTTYPLSALDVPAMFDPAKRDQLQARCAKSTFVHLFNETWRRAGIPDYLGPPAGSYIDGILRQYGFESPLPRMELGHVLRWTAYLTLHEEFQAGQRAYRLANEALKARVAALEQENADIQAGRSPPVSSVMRNAIRKTPLLADTLRLVLRKMGR